MSAVWRNLSAQSWAAGSRSVVLSISGGAGLWNGVLNGAWSWGLFGAGIGSMARGGGISGSIGGMDWAGTDATPAATKKNSRRQKPADQSKLGAAKENGAGKVSDTGKESDPAKVAETLTAQSVGRSTALAADWTDIAATLDGDGQAYARLVRRYQDQITAQMWRLSRQRNDCEQLVHEVFVEAYMSLRQFKGARRFCTGCERSPRGWDTDIGNSRHVPGGKRRCPCKTGIAACPPQRWERLKRRRRWFTGC